MAGVGDQGEGMREQTAGHFQNHESGVQGHADGESLSEAGGRVRMTVGVAVMMMTMVVIVVVAMVVAVNILLALGILMMVAH